MVDRRARRPRARCRPRSSSSTTSPPRSAPDEILVEVRVPEAHRLGRALREVQPGGAGVVDRRGGGGRAGRRRLDRRGPGRADEHGLDPDAGDAASSRRWSGSRPRPRPITRGGRARGGGHAARRPTATPTPSTASTWPGCSPAGRCGGRWRLGWTHGRGRRLRRRGGVRRLEGGTVVKLENSFTVAAPIWTRCGRPARPGEGRAVHAGRHPHRGRRATRSPAR